MVFYYSGKPCDHRGCDSADDTDDDKLLLWDG